MRQPGWFSRHRRPVVVILVLLLLVLVLAKCLADGDLPIGPGKKDEPKGGGTVEVVASEEACWTLTAMDQAQADADARENERLPETTASPSASATSSAEPQVFTGCGPSTVQLPSGTAYAGLGFSIEDDDDRHPLLWAAVLWLTRDKTPRAGFFASPGWLQATTYERWPNQTYLTAPYEDEKRSTGFFAPTPDMAIDPPLLAKATKDAPAARGVSSGLADAVEELEGVEEPSRADLEKVYDAGRRAGEVSSFLTTFSRLYAPDDYDTIPVSLEGEDGVKEFNKAAKRIAALGDPEKALVAAVRGLAYDQQVIRIKDGFADSSYAGSTAYEIALGHVPSLKLLDPTRKQQTAKLESTIRNKFTTLKAAEEQEERDRLANCIDGDGDGVCFES